MGHDRAHINKIKVEANCSAYNFYFIHFCQKMNAKARICKNLEAFRSKWGWCKRDVHFPGIESFDFYINFSKAKVTNLAILSYVLRNNMGNDIFLKKYFFTVIVKNGSCTLFGQTSHCAPAPFHQSFSSQQFSAFRAKNSFSNNHHYLAMLHQKHLSPFSPRFDD